MFEYETKGNKQLKNDYNRHKYIRKNGFRNVEDFKSWCDSQDKVCVYCGVSEQVCQQIVLTGLLRANKFPKNGRVYRDKERGMWLEVDKMEPIEKYSRNNCVLACYFCNNDKSDVFNYEQYKMFRENRYSYLKNLICE
jgi:hypothetical protein